MKTLSILRHAKAEHAEKYPSDLERPLTSRGQKDAAQIASLLAEFDPPIDWVISSPALRTRQTVEAIVPVLGFKRAVVWDQAIYLADAETLLQTVSIVPPETEHLLLVGHNPGLEQFVSGLCAGDPTRLQISLAAATVVYVELGIFSWNQIRWGSGSLHAIVKAKWTRVK